MTIEEWTLQEAIRLIEQGLSLRDAAKSLGCSHPHVSNVLARNGYKVVSKVIREE